MKKEEVIALMTKTIVDLNVGLAKQANISDEEIAQMIEVTTPQMDIVNNIMYETLRINGVIVVDEVVEEEIIAE
jgi:transcriptional/translational regulatory protein YebC/TACO1